MAIVLVFEVFSSGVAGAMAKSLLPGKGSKLVGAFFVSAVMNLTFGPAMMLFHRMTDTFIDLKCESPGVRAGVEFLAPVEILPGENELESLAFGAFRVLRGEETAREYDLDGVPSDGTRNE